MNDASPNNLEIFYCVSVYRYEKILHRLYTTPEGKKRELKIVIKLVKPEFFLIMCSRTRL
jgi:hypothetical protein